MSLAIIKTAMSHCHDVSNWRLYAINYQLNRKQNIEYEAFPISFSDPNSILDIVNSSITYFIEKTLPKKESVESYNPYNPNQVINKFNISDTLINESIKLLQQSLHHVNNKTCFKDMKCNSYLIQGSYKEDGSTEHIISFITIKTPFYNFKNKKIFKAYERELKKVTETLFNFTNTFDILIIDQTVYMISSNCERFLNLEKSYRKKCSDKLQEISKADIIEDFPDFESAATCGYYPRRFATFNDEKFKAIQKIPMRKKVAEKLGISLNSKNQFIVKNEKLKARLVKTLCDKTRIDFINDNALCEVPASKPLE
jgi:hypothetical protein